MSTFGVRTLPRVLLLVVTDPEKTFSATELERFRLRPFPLRASLLLARPSEIPSAPSPTSSLSLHLQTLPSLRSLSVSPSTPHTHQSFLSSSSPLLCLSLSAPAPSPLSLPLLPPFFKPLASLPRLYILARASFIVSSWPLSPSSLSSLPRPVLP